MSMKSGAYEPQEHESKIYEQWEKAGLFKPNPKKKKIYSVVIPPPNITGELHIGHALNVFIQDILVRWKRMSGFQTLWLPGADHAGIATQNVVEKKLKKQGLSRHDLGREKFLAEIWNWKKEYGNKIFNQLKRLGASCDWSRTKFTMDAAYQEAVKAAFVQYYKKGWIYQGERVINWCPRCQTSLSDLELEYKEEKGKLWYLKYPLEQSVQKQTATGLPRPRSARTRNDDYITVATTRPETMLGDTAVAVNPKDERYKKLIGKKVVLPLMNREIPVIANRLIDIDFGAGAVKVTPAHSIIDAEIGLRHKLEIIRVIDEQGKMTKEAGQFAGLSVLEAREKIVAELEKLNLIEKIEDYVHQVPHCYRCDRTIEPLLSRQWFVKMDELAKKATQEVKSGRIKFHPKRWEKVYSDWLKNIRDWCISRQIWWGHQLPVWEVGKKYVVALKAPKNGKQVPDVLDTWFSSALWPFATLGWPKKTADFKKFYPTNTLTTARDIINLWVTRMIFSGLEFTGQKPFDDIIIHATILTKDGQRMSKSLGTGVDPLKLVDQYGADAARFGLIYQSLGGQDIRFSEENIVMGKKFANKIWNASRFVQMKTKSAKLPQKLTTADKKIIQQLKKTIKTTDKELKKFRFGQAAHSLYDFFWRDFCGTYLETAKKQESNVLGFILLNSLKLLHPFLPFVTETIYQELPFKDNQFLITSDWPK